MIRPRCKKPLLFPCVVCDQETISKPLECEICPICGWEDDPLQADEPDEEGANPISLNVARRRWRKHLRSTPKGSTPTPLFRFTPLE